MSEPVGHERCDDEWLLTCKSLLGSWVWPLEQSKMALLQKNGVEYSAETWLVAPLPEADHTFVWDFPTELLPCPRVDNGGEGE